MLLLRGMCDGMPEAGGNPAGASADEPGEVCAGETGVILSARSICHMRNERKTTEKKDCGIRNEQADPAVFCFLSEKEN
jgi:hypothetical protein